MKTKLQLILVLILYLASFSNAFSQVYPAGFSQVQVVNGISSPTVMTFAPDGRIFIAQQNGALRVVKNNVLLATPAIDIDVDAAGERGLIGLVLHPQFSTNNFIYFYYTTATGTKRNRISRFTFTGDIINPSSEVVIRELDPLSTATNHNGGAMHFSADGKLFVAVGENANGSHAQNLDTYHGKILRLNADGTIPADNPFPTGSNQRRSVWALGLRNPYTFDIQPGTGRIFVNDVGQNTWEEINNATVAGRNFGWPSNEGIVSGTTFTNPVYAYSHGTGDGRGCAITGGVFFNPASSNYPTSYTGKYFFMDLCNNWINFIDPALSTPTRNPFATSLPGNSLSIEVGLDGNLYFLNRNNGALYKIIYTVNTAPVITDQPDNVTVAVGQTASFSVSATGTAPLSFQWRKDGVNITGATSSTYTKTNVQLADSGLYRVLVSNSAGSVLSSEAKLTVTTNQPPTATIVSPAAGLTYKGGDTISFSGTASDPEQGTLPASAFAWEMEFWHGTGGSQHVHSGPPIATGVRSGSYVIPTSGETADDVFYRLILRVTDAGGLTNTKSVDILPRKSTISHTTSPAGLQLLLDGQPVATPFSDLGVEGIQRTIGVVSPQTVGGITYTFSHWQHGGAASQTIITPENDVTYTAVFTSTLRDPENPANTVNGLEYSYYQGAWSVLPDFNTLTPAETGNVANFDLSPRNREDDYAFRYTGYIDIPADGNYTFYTSSDDGSRLYIGNTLVVDNDGLHATREASGSIGLKAGKHAITMAFFEHLGSAVLTVSYSGAAISKRVIPSSTLYRIAPSTFAVNINFQPVGEVPAGYLADVGSVYGSRGNGYTYGWNATTNET